MFLGTHTSTRPASIFQNLATILPLFVTMPGPFGTPVMALKSAPDDLKFEAGSLTVTQLLGWMVTAHGSLLVDQRNIVRPRIILSALREYLLATGDKKIQEQFDSLSQKRQAKGKSALPFTAAEFHSLVRRHYLIDLQPEPEASNRADREMNLVKLQVAEAEAQVRRVLCLVLLLFNYPTSCHRTLD